MNEGGRQEEFDRGVIGLGVDRSATAAASCWSVPRRLEGDVVVLGVANVAGYSELFRELRMDLQLNFKILSKLSKTVENIS